MVPGRGQEVAPLDGYELVKVQAVIRGSGHDLDLLVYNESRSLSFTCPSTLKLRQALRGRLKAYFHAAVDYDAEEWTIVEEAPDQSW